MYIVQEIIWRKKLEKIDVNFNYTYFEKATQLIVSSNVLFFHIWHRVCACALHTQEMQCTSRNMVEASMIDKIRDFASL